MGRGGAGRGGAGRGGAGRLAGRRPGRRAGTELPRLRLEPRGRYRSAAPSALTDLPTELDAHPPAQVFELEPGVGVGAAWREVATMRACTHRRVLPLLGVAIQVGASGGAGLAGLRGGAGALAGPRLRPPSHARRACRAPARAPCTRARLSRRNQQRARPSACTLSHPQGRLLPRPHPPCPSQLTRNSSHRAAC